MTPEIELVFRMITALSFPFAIFLYLRQRRKEADDHGRYLYESLSSKYDDFLTLSLSNSDLRLWTREALFDASEEQEERIFLLFQLLISLFERAYVLTYSDHMTQAQARRWSSWDRYMEDWSRREDFRHRLTVLLAGYDPDFAAYILNVVERTKAS